MSVQRRVTALTMTSKRIEVGEDDEDERNKSLPPCRCVLACSIRYQSRPSSSIVQCIRRHTSSSLNVLEPVSVEEVVKLVRAMQSKSSPRDILPTSLLKSCIDVIASAIAHITNLSFQDGYFPDGFKAANFLSLLKRTEID